MSGGKHLAKGSPQPILPDDGLLRVYSMRFCPYAHRAHLALNYKKIPHHSVFINLSDKPEWLSDFSSTGKVPALHLVTEPGQPSIIESLVICEYLDEKYPENPLLSKDPLQKAKDRIFLNKFDPVPLVFMRTILRKVTLNDLWTELRFVEEELAQRGTTYFGGAEPSYVDYMIWPWFERLPLLKITFADEWTFDEQQFVQLRKWVKLMQKDDTVLSFFADAKTHAEFLRTRLAGNASYDLLADA